MRANTVLTIAAVALFSGAAAHADPGETTDKVKAALTPGEMVLTGSQVKTIFEGKEAREYRVCVKTEKQEKQVASMKVMHDGQETVLKPGDCQNVTAKKIDATPAETLSGSTHIVATFHHVKPKSKG